MASKWHYSKNGEKLGPVPIQRLKELAASGELGPNDLVWKEGLTEWRPASTLKGLFPETQAKPVSPPPLPAAAPPLAAESTRQPDFFDRARGVAEKAKAKAGEYQKRVQAASEGSTPSRSYRLIGLAGGGVLLALVLVCGLLGSLFGPAATKATHVTAQDVSLAKGGVGAIDSGNESVTITLFYQHTGEAVPSDAEASKGIVLKKGTGVIVLKNQMRTTNISSYMCDFVHVVDGEHRGAEGWLVDTYVLPNH